MVNLKSNCCPPFCFSGYFAYFKNMCIKPVRNELNMFQIVNWGFQLTSKISWFDKTRNIKTFKCSRMTLILEKSMIIIVTTMIICDGEDANIIWMEAAQAFSLLTVNDSLSTGKK